jgi:hypothetical protein
VRVVLAAAYGRKRSAAPSTGRDSPDSDDDTTPIAAESPEMVVTIFAAPQGGASLRLSQAEWIELWTAFKQYSDLPLSDTVANYIYHLCAFQVCCDGLTAIHCLVQLLEQSRSNTMCVIVQHTGMLH